MKKANHLIKKLGIPFIGYCLIGNVQASPLKLDYSVSDMGGGTYNYDFSLTLDNNDNSWAPGQGWSWFIFGDALNSTSPLVFFMMDNSDFPVGPWTKLSESNGGHNGPTFHDLTAFWYPNTIGETLSWSGTSISYVASGELLFSTLITDAGAIAADFTVAENISPPPVPTPTAPTIAMLATGIAGLYLVKRRTKTLTFG